MAAHSTCPPLTRDSVIEARKIISSHVHYTPVLQNRTLDQLASTPQSAQSLGGTPWVGRKPAVPKFRLWFKCENFQRTGAFKVRGAFHAIERLKQEPGWLEHGGREKGVAGHSSGNHAAALALAARESGLPAFIVMPKISPANKIAATRGYGAKVIFSGSTSTEREAVAARVVAETGARLVPPYDHPDIILGQGTLGLELQEQVQAMMAQQQQPLACNFHSSTLAMPSAASKGLNAIMAPVGGAGMLSGVALSCDGTGILVFGSEPEFEGADDCKKGFEQGTRIADVSTLTVADGLRTPVGEIPWSLIYGRRLVTSIYSVSESQILAAAKLVLERFKLVVEPSAAVPLAVALYNEDFRSMVEREAGEDGWDLGIVFSGGNISVERLGELY
ncbi:pyridoxal-phosphate dependent enzyme [Ilyonectria destructans]|nr:pyridoxal-phosphate dependent enzyme [Ilyonectria destructans]